MDEHALLAGVETGVRRLEPLGAQTTDRECPEGTRGLVAEDRRAAANRAARGQRRRTRVGDPLDPRTAMERIAPGVVGGELQLALGEVRHERARGEFALLLAAHLPERELELPAYDTWRDALHRSA